MKKNRSSKSKWAAFSGRDGTFNFESLSDAQKEELYSDCEQAAPKPGTPLTPVQQRLHKRARRRGRPRRGKGARVVSLSIERDLLRRAERLARTQGISRSDLFCRGVRAMLALAGAA